ncbi:hypothetical protein D6745_04665 [Candidatus Woesearchaeota archaeon]|nr:MAG: hypothetical protein D6745_04665 [Candidatus Woesearchaeota archaeon]
MKSSVFAILAILVLTLSACSSPKPDDDIEKSIQNGLKYLKSVWRPDKSFDDIYLEYVYPGEDLKCPIEGCRLTYRIQDAYFDLVYISREVDDYSIINSQVRWADKVLRSILPIWEESGIYNMITSGPEDVGGVALDSSCILGQMYNSTKISDKIIRHIYNWTWMEQNYYGDVEAWRNVADDSWCIRLLSINGREKYLKNLTNAILNETYWYLGRDDITNMNKVGIIIHIIYVLNDLKKYNNIDDYENDLLALQEMLVELSEKDDIKEDLLLQANILDALSESKYQKLDKLKAISDRLIKAQQPTGEWLADENNPNYGQVFTTFRAILGLSKYKHWKNEMEA